MLTCESCYSGVWMTWKIMDCVELAGSCPLQKGWSICDLSPGLDRACFSPSESIYICHWYHDYYLAHCHTIQAYQSSELWAELGNNIWYIVLIICGTCIRLSAELYFSFQSRLLTQKSVYGNLESWDCQEEWLESCAFCTQEEVQEQQLLNRELEVEEQRRDVSEMQDKDEPQIR